jgi:hypothetical protein
MTSKTFKVINMQNNDSDTIKRTEKNIELAFTAVMTEYSCIRDAALSRDKYRSSIINFFLLLLSASISALDYILSMRFFYIFLIIAIIFATLGMLYFFHTNLNNYLISYEHNVLRKQAENLIFDASERSGKKGSYKVLQWQGYYKNCISKKRKMDGITIAFTLGLVGALPLLGSIAFICIYFLSIPLSTLHAYDYVYIIIACLFVIGLFAASIQAVISGLSVLIKLE